MAQHELPSGEPQTPPTNETELAPRMTTMKNVASTLAVMCMEETLINGGTIEFPSLGITLTKADLVGPIPDANDQPTP